MSPARTALEEQLEAVTLGEPAAEVVTRLVAGGATTLEAVAGFLRERELSLEAVERVEAIVKGAIQRLAGSGPSLAAGHALALAQQRMGLFHKLKSYAVKAASPLGYSVFFQRPGEGFSFQRHVEHKVEIFHILAAPPGSYAFVCDYAAWSERFEPKCFSRWLDGGPDAAFDRFRLATEPGDLIVIDRLNVVHTVVGCVLEEFATISTDLVDRLFDQNVGRPIPSDFGRERVTALLADLPEVEPRRLVEVGAGGFVTREIVPETREWGELRSVSVGALVARHLAIGPNATTEAFSDPAAFSSLFVRAGSGTLTLSSEQQPGESATVALAPGDLTLVPAGLVWSLTASPESPLRVSEQRLPLNTALGS